MLEVRDRKCRDHYGEDVWAAAAPQTKACFDFLCGNHTRNLPVVRFNKVRFLLCLHATCCLLTSVSCREFDFLNGNFCLGLESRQKFPFRRSNFLHTQTSKYNMTLLLNPNPLT